MALLFALWLGFLPVQLASSCVISGPSVPVLFFPARGEDVCSGVESAWCFQFKLVADGSSVIEATGCAEWLLEVARNAPPGLNEELALAAEICDVDPNGVYNKTYPDGAIIVQCSPTECDEITKEPSSEMTTSNSRIKTNVCPVEGEEPGVFIETEGEGICKNSEADWCFQYEASYVLIDYTVRGCSQWLGVVSERDGSGKFLKEAFTHCTLNNSAVFEKRIWFWSYKMICSPAMGPLTAETTSIGTETTTSLSHTTPGYKTTGMAPSEVTTFGRTETTEGGEGNTKEVPITEPAPTPFSPSPTVSEPAENIVNETDQPTTEYHCNISSTPGWLDEQEGLKICQNKKSPWCFEFTITSPNGSIVTEKASGCSEWLDKLIQDENFRNEHYLFFMDAHYLCRSGYPSYHLNYQPSETYNVFCHPTNLEPELNGNQLAEDD